MIRSCLAILLCLAARVLAHPTMATVVAVEVEHAPAGGTIEVRVVHDALAYALNETSARVMDWQMHELLEGPPRALEAALLDGRERFASGFEVFLDGRALRLHLVDSPTIDSVEQWAAENPSLRLPMAMEFVLRGTLPPAAGDASIRAPLVLDEILLAVHRPGLEVLHATVEAGQRSDAFQIDLTRSAKRHREPEPEPLAAEPRLAGARDGFRSFLVAGTQAQLFLLTLLLIRIDPRTLASAVGLLVLAPALVSPIVPQALILPTAAAWVAVLATATLALESLVRKEPSRLRYAMVLLGAVCHGVLLISSTGTPTHASFPSVAGAAVGVVITLAVCYGLLGWYRHASWFRRAVAVPVLGIVLASAIVLGAGPA